ncbi:hypothetical protein [Microvirga yunnanensis]|uniref:hypothetical protein n=1 Tax=Microvirga yunnanensis TaxID=2953740 RepID=UPI0021CA3A38|nr:hypothetical protein [Microvirga sp. HBU67655]
MPLDRFYVPIEGHVNKEAAFLCGFQWLLGRPEPDLRIAFNSKDNLEDVFKAMLAKYGSDKTLTQMFTALLKHRYVQIQNGPKITAVLLNPRLPSHANGACLGVWVDTKQLAKIETALGPVGAVCAAPWGKLDIDAWVQTNSPAPLECDGGGETQTT